MKVESKWREENPLIAYTKHVSDIHRRGAKQFEASCAVRKFEKQRKKIDEEGRFVHVLCIETSPFRGPTGCLIWHSKKKNAEANAYDSLWARWRGTCHILASVFDVKTVLVVFHTCNRSQTTDRYEYFLSGEKENARKTFLNSAKKEYGVQYLLVAVASTLLQHSMTRRSCVRFNVRIIVSRSPTAKSTLAMRRWHN